MTEHEDWVEAELVRLQHNADEIDELVRVVASLVIARGEHANVIRALNAAATRFEGEIAVLRRGLSKAHGDIATLRDEVAHFEHHQAVVDYELVQVQVDGVEDRLGEIEQALPEIERRLKLRRREGAWTPPLDAGS